ncbi:MAG: hypothetical protein CVV02_08720 [Firmicutes bacterium HGW-Firmicutes-7]|nr:MAG: hypothetical protein CVV02_08720 [Firmicutes bacterium HGW-Firmicutes-7]
MKRFVAIIIVCCLIFNMIGMVDYFILDSTVLANESYINVIELGISNNGADVTAKLNSLPSGNYYFPKGIYGIDGKDYQGFKPKSNSSYHFENGAVLKVLTNGYTHYAGILIRNCDNVTLINPTIEGDRITHDYTSEGTHEWGHGIIITDGCGKIVINNPYIYDVTGDGIDFICEGSDVTVNNLTIKRARRQGISIESAGVLNINGGLIEDISGTSPEAGIDIEPYKMGQHLDDVTISNIITRRTKQGLLFANLHMANNYKVSINNSTFDGIYVCNSEGAVEGEININDPIINGSNVALYWTNAYVNMNIRNPIFVVDNLNNDGTREGIFRFSEQDKENGDIIGGLTCTNAQILNSQSECRDTRIFNFSNSSKSTVTDIHISVSKSNMTNTIWATTPSSLRTVKLSEPKNINVTIRY